MELVTSYKPNSIQWLRAQPSIARQLNSTVELHEGQNTLIFTFLHLEHLEIYTYAPAPMNQEIS